MCINFQPGKVHDSMAAGVLLTYRVPLAHIGLGEKQER